MTSEFKRSKLQICFKVLDVIMKGTTKPTRIMYSANVSWNNIMGVLMVLTSQGLIKVTRMGDSRRYTLTEKGLEALTHYKMAMDSLKQEKTNWALTT